MANKIGVVRVNSLIHNEKLLELIFNSLDEGILIIDESNEVYFVNNRFLTMINMKDNGEESLSFSKLVENEKIRDFFVLDGIERQGEIQINGNYLFLNYIPYEGTSHKFHIFFLKDVTDIEDTRSQLMELKFNLDMVEDLLNYVYEGFALVDSEGRIVKWNYEKLLGIKEEDALGRPVQEVIENTRLHIVAKTGKKEIRDIQRIQGRDMVANRIPIIRGGKVIGAVGTVLFKDASDVREMAKELIGLENKLNQYKGELERLQDSKYTFDSIITQDPKMKYLKKMAQTAAQSNSTVLILGESGTGKELFAQAIHKASYRKFGPFVPINCAAIPRDLLESELFGYEEGSFTGAKKGGKPGKFELASGGTIFLDEIGTMPLQMQAKLLRVLEEREFERIGGNKKIILDARIIAATNEDIEEAVKKGKFREDLYYRLNVINIDIPPLRDRKEDIPLLAKHLLENLCNELDTEKKILKARTIEILKEYHWPGNIRELRNTLERAITISTGTEILPEHLPERILKKGL
ncbi:MAG: sigma 54-interacting transcriptional regulator, partial [Tissierellia bacterium]|nr:sigma 54-interacting transcriptional regulator [Tissierellia bacterium]